MEVVPAEDYYSVLSTLKSEIIQSNSAAFSSIIEKYICLSNGLSPPQTDINLFYSASNAHNKHLMKFLREHRPEGSAPPKCKVANQSLANHKPGDTVDEEFSRQIQETLRKRKVQLGLREDYQTCEVVEDGDCDIESFEPNNQWWQNVCDAKIIDEKSEKKSGSKNTDMNCCVVRKSERLKIKHIVERGVPSQGWEENASEDKAENASQEKEKEISEVRRKIHSEGTSKTRKEKVKLGYVEKESSQDKDFDSEKVFKITDKNIFKKAISIKLKRIDNKHLNSECDNPKRDSWSYVKDLQKSTPDTLQEKEGEVNVLHKTKNESQNRIKKAPQGMKEICSKRTPEIRKTKIKFGNKEANASPGEKGNLTTLERKNRIKDKSLYAETSQNNSGRGKNKTSKKKVTGCENDTNKNKRELSNKVTKSHSSKYGHSVVSRTVKELVDVRPGNFAVVLTKSGDTIFLPPLAEHEEDDFTSNLGTASSEDNPPVFFVTFSAQDAEVSQPVRSPLNSAAAEPVMVGSNQKKSKVILTPQEESDSCKGDKSIGKNKAIERAHKTSQNKIDCVSPIDAATAEPVTKESCQKKSQVIVMPLEEYKCNQVRKSKRKDTLLEEIDKDSQNEKNYFARLPPKVRNKCSQPEEPHYKQRNYLKKTMDGGRGPKENVSLTPNKKQSLSGQKLSQTREQVNDTSGRKIIFCSQKEKTFVVRSRWRKSLFQKENTSFNVRSPQSKSPSQKENTSFNVRSPQSKSPSQKENTLCNMRSPRHKSPSQKDTTYNVRSPQHKSPSQKDTTCNVRSPQHKSPSQEEDTFCNMRSPQYKSPSQKDTTYNVRSPQHKSSSQNISHAGLNEKKVWNKETLATSCKRVQEEVGNERSELIQESLNGTNHRTLSSLTFCKEKLSQPLRKPIIKRKLSKGRIVFEFFDRNAHRKERFGILEDNSLHDENELGGEKVMEDSKRQVGTDATGVSNVKSRVSSNIGEISQEQGSMSNNVLNKGETKGLSSRKWQNCEESIIAGIDAVKRKRKSLFYGLPMALDHPKGFLKPVQHGEQNCSARSILIRPEVLSIAEDVTGPLLSSTRSEMLNVVTEPGGGQRQIPKPQNEHSHRRRKVDGFLSEVVAKKPKLDNPLQLQKNFSLEKQSLTFGKPNIVVGTNVNNSVPTGKQTDTNTLKIRGTLSKHLTDSTRGKDVPSYHAKNSDSDEELTLLPVEPSFLAAGPHHSSLYTVSKLWSTLHTTQLQNTQVERFQTRLPATNSTANSTLKCTTEVNKNSQSFWELDDDKEIENYTNPLASNYKSNLTVMQESVSNAFQSSMTNQTANTSSIPNYSILGGKRWVAAVRSEKRHIKPFLLGASFSFAKNKRYHEKVDSSKKYH